MENKVIMLLRAARKRLLHSFGMHPVTKLYVVSPSGVGRRMRIGEVLRHYPRVVLLDTVDDSTALVKMSERDRIRLSRQHPELAIEPNITYRKLG